MKHYSSPHLGHIGFLIVFVAIFFSSATVANACRLVCNGEVDTFSQWDQGVSVCYGSVEWQGCDAYGPGDPGPTVGGGGGDDFSTVTADISATPSSIISGNSSRLTWSSTNASTCSIDQGIGSVTPVSSGERIVNPTTTTTYTLVCSDAVGRTATDTATVTVTQAPQPFAVSCAVAPSTAQVNETVQWSGAVVTGATSGLAWKRGNTFTTKICTGGQNASAPHRTCPEGIDDGDACTVEGQRCRDSSGCDGHTYTDGSGQPNAHTVYGSVTPYTCTATGSGQGTYTYSWTGTDGLTGTGQSLPWSYGIAGAKTGTVTAVSTSGSSASATCALTVNGIGTDLIAGAVSAPGAARGATVTISAPIQNVGDAAAGPSHAYYELIAPSSKQNTSNVFAIGALGPGASLPASFTYTFGSAGNYQVRFCADWYGTVPEANEGNNCGPWTELNIPETPVSSSVSCTVSPTSTTAGQSVTYTAIPVGAATSPYTWTPSDGVGSYGTSETAVRTFAVPGSYGMQVSATNGNGAANCPLVTVSAGYCAAGNANVTITATPSRVRAGQPTTIAWSATGIPGAGASCTVSGPGVSWTSAVTASPQCSASGSANTTISTQSTYTITCGAASKSVTVNVIPNFQEF